MSRIENLAVGVLTIENRDQPRTLPDFAFESVSLHAPRLCDSIFISRSFDPIGQADVARSIETIDPIVSHRTPGLVTARLVSSESLRENISSRSAVT